MAKLRADEVDAITITEVKYEDMPDYTKDIVVEFPDYLDGVKRISFMEAGLINAIPGVAESDDPDQPVIKETEDSNEVIPKVAIQFYGQLKTVYE